MTSTVSLCGRIIALYIDGGLDFFFFLVLIVIYHDTIIYSLNEVLAIYALGKFPGVKYAWLCNSPTFSRESMTLGCARVIISASNRPRALSSCAMVGRISLSNTFVTAFAQLTASMRDKLAPWALYALVGCNASPSRVTRLLARGVPVKETPCFGYSEGIVGEVGAVMEVGSSLGKGDVGGVGESGDDGGNGDGGDTNPSLKLFNVGRSRS